MLLMPSAILLLLDLSSLAVRSLGAGQTWVKALRKVVFVKRHTYARSGRASQETFAAHDEGPKAACPWNIAGKRNCSAIRGDSATLTSNGYGSVVLMAGAIRDVQLGSGWEAPLGRPASDLARNRSAGGYFCTWGSTSDASRSRTSKSSLAWC